MNRIYTNNIYLVPYEDLYLAYIDCIKHKKNTSSCIEFMMNEEENLNQLLNELNNRTFNLGRSIVFISNEGALPREVFAALFRDRIVHHLVKYYINDIIEKYGYSSKSYSCRVGKGTDYGVHDILNLMNEIHKLFPDLKVWYAKCDLSRFFININKDKLYNYIFDLLSKYIEDKLKFEFVIWLIKLIIYNRPLENAIFKHSKNAWKVIEEGKSMFDIEDYDEKGLPIGNLTSLMLANLFLRPLDDMIMSKVLGYGRYVDDFIILDTDKEKIKNVVNETVLFLNNEFKIKFNKKKLQIQPVTYGVRFLGKIIKPHTIYALNRTYDVFKKRLSDWCVFFKLSYKKDPNKDIEYSLIQDFVSSINSYLGFLKSCNSYRRVSFIINSLKNLKYALKYVDIAEDYSKMSINEYYKNKHKLYLYNLYENSK